MAERYSFFNDVNGDRVYQASDFVEYFKQFNSNGVFKNPSNNLQVSASSGMSVTVSAGAGYINGYLYILDQAKTLTLLDSDPNLNRKDIIVLNLDFINRNMSILVKRGTAASTAIAPTPANSASMIELVLAEISIPKGLTSITSSNITDTRGDGSRCGYISSLVPPDTSTQTRITNNENNKRDKSDVNFTGKGQAKFDKVQVNPNQWFLIDGTNNPTSNQAFDLNNSDLTGINGLFFNDIADAIGEGIYFLKTGAPAKSTNPADYDKLHILDGKVYLNDNFIGGKYAPFIQRITTKAQTSMTVVNTYYPVAFGTQTEKNFNSTTNEYIIPETGQYEFTANLLFDQLTAETVQSIYMKIGINGVQSYLSFKHTKRATEQLIGTYAGNFNKGDKVQILVATSVSTTARIAVTDWNSIQVKAIKIGDTSVIGTSY